MRTGRASASPRATARPLLVVIVGPTASGKSDLAVSLAQKFNGEVVSADSRQIYRGLNLGTGKVPGRWTRRGVFVYRRIPHHCLDEVAPRTVFSVAQYKSRAQAAIRDIRNRHKLPILAGGSGFWIDTVVYNLSLPEVPPNRALRRKLNPRTPAELFAQLRRLDPERAQSIDPKNPRRLIRAIEIAKVLGRVPKIRRRSRYTPLWLGIRIPARTLRKRIRHRLITRLRQGLLEEAKRLRRERLSWKRFYELGLEYKYVADCLRGLVTRKRMIAELEAAIWQYARRQIRWQHQNPKIHWVRTLAEATRLVRRFLKQDPPDLR